MLSDGTNYYLYGSTGEPVEQVNVTSSPPAANPLFPTYTASDSSWLVTNASGAQVSYYRYDAFGNLAFGIPTSPFGYAGQYVDTSSSPSGFDNMRARWYQAQTGQFSTVDPAFGQTDQAYDYAGDDPVNESDPSGACVKVGWWCIGGGAETSSIGFGFHPLAGLEGGVNFLVGGANFFVSSLTLGQVRCHSPSAKPYSAVGTRSATGTHSRRASLAPISPPVLQREPQRGTSCRRRGGCINRTY